MAVIKRERPVVLTGQSATAFLKFKLANEKKYNNGLIYVRKRHKKKGNNLRWNNVK
ncbi:hypothetical protein LQF60_11285 [Tetragenococcus koreensis]|uniref:hypothetical protein n=1 Tax=Tetragenococcus koreensis TaxID=290335 RepID=UPI001F1AAF36|nr:hypothetical protein [Tetragenococcus koreensis]MDN6640109.1 hypothetical protein [Tetragenococcus sp.]MDN6835693.1 hypothetical protein [Lactococcus lactis]MDN6839618.1 hypothetical protein [Tetragenococcus halophilus]MCF1586132.1 hypothetical protein [Tetragenococcus koreensis]MCF1615722.1 hypothetical protein [Tetragenococcus koreensis]